MFDEIDKLLIREVQGNMPLSLDPYGDIAKKIGCSRKEVIKRLKNYSEKLIMKRMVAILYHRDSGYPENGMFAAVIPEQSLNDAGYKLSAEPNVTHCYERKSYNNWPYNLYAMIHGRTRNQVEDIVENFVNDMEVEEYQILYSVEEFKKTSMLYF